MTCDPHAWNPNPADAQSCAVLIGKTRCLRCGRVADAGDMGELGRALQARANCEWYGKRPDPEHDAKDAHLDRVARAIWTALNPKQAWKHEHTDPYRDLYRRAGRAAIEATVR